MLHVIIYRWYRDFSYINIYRNVFGSKKIPEIAKGLGRAMREVKDASSEIKKEIRDSASSINDDLDVKK